MKKKISKEIMKRAKTKRKKNNKHKKEKDRIGVLNEEGFKDILENANDLIQSVDSSGRFIYVNKKWLRTLGYSKEDVKKLKLKDILRKDSVHECMKLFELVHKGKSLCNIKTVFVTKDGREIHVEGTANAKFDKGKFVFTRGIFRDITERKMAEDALRESENKYRTLLENLPQKIFFKNKNLVYVSCNENFARDRHISANKIAGKTDYDFFPKKLAEKYRKEDRRVMRSGKTEGIIEEYIPDGHKIIVHTVKTPVKDEDGNIIGILSIFWDITEHKKAEEALKASEEKFRDLIENSNDLIQSVGPDKKFVYVNKKWKKVLGYSDKEIEKLEFTNILRKDQIPHCMSIFKKLCAGQSFTKIDTVFLTKKGKEIFVSGYLDAYFKDKKFISTRGIFRDVTEQKKAEDELKKKHDELERFNQFAVGRELKIIELKKEVNELCKKLGEKPRYNLKRIRSDFP